MNHAIEETVGGEGLPKGFLDLPPLIYADDPLWIPEEPRLVEAAFDNGNLWFERGRAFALVIPERARLAVFVDPAALIGARPAAFFGYWETVGDAETDAALFARAEGWARTRGALDLYGPINFTTYGNYRLRLSAEPGAIPFPGEPYNPPFYPDRLARLGFALRETYLTQVSPMSVARELREARRRVAARAGGRYRIEALTPEVWLRHLGDMHRLADAIFGGSFAYTPLPYPAFERACGEAFIRRACPVTSVIAYGPNGEIAGLFLVYPHYGPLVVQGAGGGRVSVSELSFERHGPLLARSGYRAAVLKTVGVAPEHRHRGLMEAITVSALDRGEGRYDHWLGALIRSDNPSRRFAEGKTPFERSYALYVKRLD